MSVSLGATSTLVPHDLALPHRSAAVFDGATPHGIDSIGAVLDGVEPRPPNGFARLAVQFRFLEPER